MKKIIATIVCLAICIILPLHTSALRLILKEENVSETLIRSHFSLDAVEPYVVDYQKLTLLLDKLEEQVYTSPENAQIGLGGEIIAGKPGWKLNRTKTMEYFYSFFYSGQSKQYSIPKTLIYPKVDGELLAEISAKKIGSFKTFFRQENEERSHNIWLAAKAINNHVVFPGETFSFNKVVGKRTEKRGYERAPVIVRGELAEDIGGGICQVSSTLFNAVNLRGIEIIERYSHSREVPYVPPGKDATVSWWGPDFSFKNNFNQPILIRAQAKNGKMEIHIFSSEHVKARN
ncbi:MULTISPECIES: VanW family protein [unclassified Virgibacillus]|uniref:VanW family protein n=1 Tax=unclassified Virgibacillus TaxID=2620237 RepID=UPI0024DE1776|nr:VanW family protein [Virgibacillus sp. LDC-1]